MLAKFRNSGQSCVAANRFIVHEAVAEEFIEAFVRRTKALRVGGGTDSAADIGPLIDERQRRRIHRLVEDAVGSGARVRTGGRVVPGAGFFYEPTVLEGVTPTMRVFAEETFGPVVALHRYASDAEALAQANQGSYGLAASVWGKDVRGAEAIAVGIRAGAVSINDGAGAAAGSVEAGMGGMGDSGLGRRHGVEGMVKYTDAQTLARQRWLPLGPARGASVERFVASTTRQLRLMRRLGLR